MSGRLLLGLLASTWLFRRATLVEGAQEQGASSSTKICNVLIARHSARWTKLLPRYGRRGVRIMISAGEACWARKAAVAARYFTGVTDLGLAYRRHHGHHPGRADNFNDKLSHSARDNGIDPAQAGCPDLRGWPHPWNGIFRTA
jgi:hypothetical protein